MRFTLFAGPSGKEWSGTVTLTGRCDSRGSRVEASAAASAAAAAAGGGAVGGVAVFA